jgi:SAM-dependent methyltransferase
VVAAVQPARALPRVVEPEVLDALAPDDARARRARADLLRVHRAMATRGILARALRRVAPVLGPAPRLLELGCGDGRLLLDVARRLGWRGVTLTLLDRQPAIEASTLAAYRALDWQARPLVADVFAWSRAPVEPVDLVLASLFLHHFAPPALVTLLDSVAARTRVFVAIEPRRSRLALLGSRLVGALGVNAVTRADAVTSVRAGFRDAELAALWPQRRGWSVEERAAGPFGHLFTAVRSDA